MKKLLSFGAATLWLALAALSVACSDASSDPKKTPDPDPVPKKTVVFAVGQEAVPGQGHYYAAVWKDGARYLLTDGTADGFCNAACADGERVYVVGCEAIGDLFDDGYYEPYHLNVGILWQFDADDPTHFERMTLTDGTCAASPVAVAAANGNVHIAGFVTPGNDRRAVYWKNGAMEYLSDGKTDALAYCIEAVGDDVYVGGYVQPADKQGGVATIWKNGTPQSLTDGSTVAKVNALCYDNGVLYAAGAEKVMGGRWRGVLWTDGRPAYFTDEVGTEVTGLHVRDGKYTISGTMTASNGDFVTCLWTNDGVQVLSEGIAMCQGVALAVDGDDVYVAGNETDFDMTSYEDIYRAHLWKNGAAQPLEADTPDNMSLWGLACAYVDAEE